MKRTVTERLRLEIRSCQTCKQDYLTVRLVYGKL